MSINSTVPPTAASRTVNGDPMAPVNPPGSHPIVAPITALAQATHHDCDALRDCKAAQSASPPP
jgi:hypothetical protein